MLTGPRDALDVLLGLCLALINKTALCLRIGVARLRNHLSTVKGTLVFDQIKIFNVVFKRSSGIKFSSALL